MARETTDNIQNAKQFINIEKLSMDVGEKARLYLPEGDSMIVEFSHELRNRARPTKAEKEAGAQESKDDFYGNFLCSGDQAILNAGDLDIDGCPFCAQVQTSEGRVGRPKRAFASNLIRYATQKFDWNPIQPVQVKLLGWIHRSEKKFRTVKELKEAWGDLTGFDLLATCENPFQDLSIQVAPQSVRQDPNVAQLIQATYDNNKYSDEALIEAIGRKVDREQAERHIRTVLAANTVSAPIQPQVPGIPGAYPGAYPDPAAMAAGVPLTGMAMPQPGIPAPQQMAPQAAPPLDLSGVVPQAVPAAPPEAAAPGYPPQAMPQPGYPPQAVPQPVAAPGYPPQAVPQPVAAPGYPPQAMPQPVAVPQAAPQAMPQPVAVPAAAPQAPPDIAQAPALPPLAGLDQQG